MNNKMIFKLLAYMKHLSALIGIAVVFAVSGHVLVMVIPAMLMQLGLRALNGQSPSWGMLVLLLGLSILRGVLRYGEHYFGHHVAFHVLADFRNAVFSKLKRLAPTKLTDKNSGQLLKMIGEDIEALEVFFAHTLAPVLTGIVLTVLLVWYDATIHIGLVLIAIVTYGLLTIVLPKRFATMLKPILKEQGEARTEYTRLFVDSLKGMNDLVQFQKDKEEFDELNAKSQVVNAKEKQVAEEGYQQMTISFLVVGVSMMAVALLLLGLYQQGNLSLERAATAFVVYTSSFAAYLELNRLPLGFKRAILAGERVFALLEEEERVDDGQRTVDGIQEVKVSGVDFSYPSSTEVVLKDVSYEFTRGKIVGVVGPSGQGKSTLMKLIMNWYHPTKGEVAINGVATTEIDAKQLQSQIAYIPQIPQLFHKTLRENLQMGNRDLTDEEILAAAEKCHIKERILQASQGLDTIFNPEKPQFSAGEMQRLELTRALLKQADCYIFDEPTSHLDSLHEAEILTIIKQHCHGLVFLISHRMSTVAIADELIQL